jgi:predicted GIY-YIG superfamily endonuclease
MHYTYVLQCIEDHSRHYIGSTDDLKCRLEEHNSGKCPHTSKYKPWRIKSYFAFTDKLIATRFERYLKSGSGREFARRHFELQSDGD